MPDLKIQKFNKFADRETYDLSLDASGLYEDCRWLITTTHTC